MCVRVGSICAKIVGISDQDKDGIVYKGNVYIFIFSNKIMNLFYFLFMLFILTDLYFVLESGFYCQITLAKIL